MRGPHLKEAENGRFYIHWVDGTRSKRVTTRTTDRLEAERAFEVWLIGRRSPACAVVTSGKPDPLIRELWERYRQGHVVLKLPARSSIVDSWRILLPFFGDLRLSELDEAAVRRFIEHRRRPRRALVGHGMRDLAGAKDSTIRQNLIALSACLNWCSSPRRRPTIVDRDDVPLIDMPRPAPPRDRWLSLDEVQCLLDAAREIKLRPGSSHPTAFRRDPKRLSRLERFLWLGLETAARATAICELTWDRVDFEIGMVDFNVPGRHQTSKRRVAVPMSKGLRRVLRQAWRERTGPLVLDNASSLGPQMKEAATIAGLSGVSPHVLRHTAATHMARRGVPLWLVANVLGNTMAMTEQVYAKHCPQAMGGAVNMISGDRLRTEGVPMTPRAKRVVRQNPILGMRSNPLMPTRV